MNDTNWFEDRGVDMERCYWRRVGFVIFAALALAFILVPYANADPVLRISDRDITITIYDEPCKLDIAKNLPNRATWEEGGKKYEGCIGPWQQMGVAVAWFEDKTIAVMPISAFKRVTNA